MQPKNLVASNAGRTWTTSYIEIEKWVSELHEDYAESTVSSIFATFSTFLNATVRARIIPASPCNGIRATSGEYAPERLVASPVQALWAAMRLYGGSWDLDRRTRPAVTATPGCCGLQGPDEDPSGLVRHPHRQPVC